MKSKIRTTPDLSRDSLIHQEAAQSDDYLWRWTRNVIDEYKSLSTEEIKQKLKETSFPFAVCSENWNHDFNLASLIRNANAFNAECVYYLGNKRYNSRGSMGVKNYTDVIFLPTVNDFLELKQKYIIVGVDNIPGSISTDQFEYKPNMLFVFGSEGVGMTSAMQQMCDHMIYIKQYGSVRSINAATASGIIMFDYTTKISGQVRGG